MIDTLEQALFAQETSQQHECQPTDPVFLAVFTEKATDPERILPCGRHHKPTQPGLDTL
jgi:hypothetical protein